MPYTEKQHRFFELCKHNPGAARGKCPSKADAAKMAHEGVKKKRKKRTVPRTDKNGYY